MSALLQQLARRQLLWHGNSQQAAYQAVTSGYPELDQQLAGGFPSTGLIHVSFSLVLTAIAIYFASGYGITAVAASWLITTPLFFLFAVYLCASRAGISSMAIIKAVMPPLLLSSVMLGLLYGMQQLVLADMAMLPRLLIMVVTGAVFYALTLRLCFKERFNEALKFRL